jgi:hypothetical protein
LTEEFILLSAFKSLKKSGAAGFFSFRKVEFQFSEVIDERWLGTTLGAIHL